VRAGGGRYRYAVAPQEGQRFSETRMRRVFKDNVQSCDFSENIVVVRTAPGAAGTVASALDASAWSEVIGTIAGDDHIFVLIRPKEAAADIVARIQKLMH